MFTRTQASLGWAPLRAGKAPTTVPGIGRPFVPEPLFAPRAIPSMADIVIINPRFDVSFWGMELVLPLMGKRAAMPVACLPLLAALTPAGHDMTLIDENVEAIDFERCAAPTSSASPEWAFSGTG